MAVGQTWEKLFFFTETIGSSDLVSTWVWAEASPSGTNIGRLYLTWLWRFAHFLFVGQSFKITEKNQNHSNN